MIDLVGQTLLRYRLDVAMRAGYSGQVYRARDTESGSDVALKLFKPSTAPEAMKSALQPLLSLKHPNIVQSLEIGAVYAAEPLFAGKPSARVSAGAELDAPSG